MKDEFDAGPNDVWKDDDAFRNLAKSPGLTLHKLSYHCASVACSECDGIIRYKFKKLESSVFNLRTGMNEENWIDFEWDTDHTSVQIQGGTQNKRNTPEGSPCECFCHTSKKYKEMIVGTHSPKSVGRMAISKYKQDELSPEEREGLK